MSPFTNESTTNASFFSGLLQSVAERGRALVRLGRAEVYGVEALLGMSVKLLAGRGEASGAALAQTILSGYAKLAAAQRLEFLLGVATRYGHDLNALGE